MIGYALVDRRLQQVDDVLGHLDELLWVDLHNTPIDQITQLEARLGIDIPTEDEMVEIEISSRLYHEDGCYFMTATLPAQTDSDNAAMAPVSFVLTDKLLITIRTTAPRAFVTFPTRAQSTDLKITDPGTLLLCLLEAIVDRLADVLERASRDIDVISALIFSQADPKHSGHGSRKSTGNSADNHVAKATDKSSYQLVLRQLGRKGDLVSDLRESLMSMRRMSGYLSLVAHEFIRNNRAERDRLKTLGLDLDSISEHAGFMSQKVTFLLDATLGMINIEQNATIKIFSVLAVIFMPPTMIASIYGMNFEAMPELSWPLGYPAALLLMLVAAVFPYWYFKRRGWL